jgi:hypothetical protein
MLALIAAFVRPQTGAGAQITISQDETTEPSAAIETLSERVTMLQKNIHALTKRRRNGGCAVMIVGVLIAVWVFVLRILYQTNCSKRDRRPVSWRLVRPALRHSKENWEISEQVAHLENDYEHLARRMAGQHQ